MRALGVSLPGLSRKTIDRRPFPPGQHGQSRRGKLSDYGRQLKEKQKVRLNYGLSERQFRRLVREAKSSRVATGDKLLELLERRLDNVIFRAGYAPTIPAARQLVGHRHVLVNGKRVNIPSYRIRAGDVVTLRDKSLELQCVQDALEETWSTRAGWIEFDKEKKVTKVLALPDPESVLFPIDINFVVEYYAKRM
jgi:small subunit ribosomal protein S4